MDPDIENILFINPETLINLSDNQGDDQNEQQPINSLYEDITEQKQSTE